MEAFLQARRQNMDVLFEGTHLEVELKENPRGSAPIVDSLWHPVLHTRSRDKNPKGLWLPANSSHSLRRLRNETTWKSTGELMFTDVENRTTSIQRLKEIKHKTHSCGLSFGVSWKNQGLATRRSLEPSWGVGRNRGGTSHGFWRPASICSYVLSGVIRNVWRPKT